jgi:citrate synthase
MSTSPEVATKSAPPAAAIPSPGLEGVVVAHTRLSEVDGERGRLIIAGHDAEELAGQVDFAGVCQLLLALGSSAAEPPARPPQAAVAGLAAGLGAARVRAAERLKDCAAAIALPDAMDALRAALAGHTAQLATDDPARLAQEAVELIGALPVYAAAWARRAAGLAPLPPDPDADHAADYLRLLTGERPDAARAAALDAYLVTVSDHGMNASTFTARVVASTGSDLVSAVVAALGALKGPLHGGAPGPVLDMLDAIGEPAQALPWLQEQLVARRRIMGMGHRVYRVRDPRAAVLEKAIERLQTAGYKTPRLSLARAVEHAAQEVLHKRYPDRALRANVEFYTAVLLDAVGLPRTLFTATFAVGRIAGWCAHVAEQRRTGRLIRPESVYVGPRPVERARPIG